MALEKGKRVSIIGCGWLGFPLAQHLVKSGCVVRGSTTSKSKIEKLVEHNIIPHQIKVTDQIVGDTASFFECDVLVINIPPGRRNPFVEVDHPKQIELILDGATLTDVGHVIFTSSTGVYKNTGGIVNENGILEPGRSSGKALVAAEKIITNYPHSWTILRMSGLVGGDRQPGRWFAGKSDLPGGDTPVNMVHLDDCITAISKVISGVDKSDFYNLCADKHPVKRQFYNLQSEKLGTERPSFQDGTVPFKIVDNQKFKTEFQFSYNHTDPCFF